MHRLHLAVNGDIYAGDWKDIVFDGKGAYIFASGERYGKELSINSVIHAKQMITKKI